MISPDASAQAAIDSGVRSLILLFDMDFSTGMQRWCTWTSNVVSGGNTYLGLANGVYDVSQISESEDNKPDKLTISFTIVNSAMLAACIGSASVYRGRSVTIYAQMLDGSGAPAGAAIPCWYGYMADTHIKRDPGRLYNAGKGKIEIDCYRAGMATMRNYEGERITDAQQKEMFPGDLGLQYMADLIQNPVPWLSIKFQQQ